MGDRASHGGVDSQASATIAVAERVRARGESDSGLAELNRTTTDFPSSATIHELVLAQVERTPEALAIQCESGSLSYRELDRQSAALASRLAEAGLASGSTVGILLDREVSLPVALLAVLRCGAAYLPLDPDYPRERKELMLEDSGARALLTDTRHASTVGREAVPRLLVDLAAAQLAPVAPTPAGDADDLAYLIYTSGSTGRPKGVEITHRSVVNFLLSMQDELGFAAGEAILAITTVSFDISVLELFLPLVAGGRVDLGTREAALDGALLAERLAAGDIRLLQATPTTWRMLLEAGWQGTPGLVALSGGEPLPARLAERLLPRCESLWNMYGPTETTIWSTLARVESAEAPIRIGRPIANTRIRIVDEQLVPVASGEVGELLIAGEGLARGYRNRPELTAERFPRLPSAMDGGSEQRFYRTGDLARVLPDGSLECLGRLDHQIKLRGFRIEPAEIEAVVESHALVSESVVLVREDEPGDRRLVAYLVTADEVDLPALAGELRDLARSRLPSYMVPAAFVRLSGLPLTGNGKLDRLALPAPSAVDVREIAGRVPAGEPELTIAAAWKRALQTSAIGAKENFFDLGGNSLLMHQIRSELESRLERKIAMVDLFREPTVAGCAQRLSEPGEALGEELGVYGKGDPHSLSLLVRRFLIPRSLVSLYFFWKFRARVSPRAEVELSPLLIFGKKTTVGSFTKVKADKGPLVIGERSSFANGCFIGSGPAGLHIGRNLVCGPNVAIVPSNYVFEDKDVHLADQGHTSKGIRIGDGVWIGANSVILDGAEIGDNSVVVAGSVVDGRFPPGSMLRGNPAEIVARR